jgi:hypothetical protein
MGIEMKASLARPRQTLDFSGGPSLLAGLRPLLAAVRRAAASAAYWWLGEAAAPTIQLVPRGAIWRIVRPAGWRVVCITGLVWVTQDGDPRDIMLAAGEECDITGDARVLVQALDSARVMLTPTPGRAW